MLPAGNCSAPMHACSHGQVLAHTPLCAGTCIHTLTHTCSHKAQSYTHVCTHSHAHIKHMPTLIHIHVHVFTRVHPWSHTCTHACTRRARERCLMGGQSLPEPSPVINVDAVMAPGAVLIPCRAAFSAPVAGVWEKLRLTVKKYWQLESRACKAQENCGTFQSCGKMIAATRPCPQGLPANPPPEGI